jgi:PhnB protein
MLRVLKKNENEAETDKVFNGLSLGGKVEMPVNKTFWGAYCGMCRDRFGVQWMVNYTYPQKQPHEKNQHHLLDLDLVHFSF